MIKTAGLKLKFLWVLIIPFLLYACNKEDEKEDFEAIADVFFIKKKINGEIKTANAYYVYANDAIESATVMSPEGADIAVSLTAIDERKYNYHHEPDSSEYTVVPPPSGNYLFEIESTAGEKIQKTDILQAVSLSVPEIISTSFNKNTSALNVKWNKVTDTDGLFVKLVNKESHSLFVSQALADSITELQIVTGGANWISSATEGDELILQIQSVVVEDDADNSLSLYNIEGTAVAEKRIIWGE